ncbi:uncharacterized protein LOC128762437 [Synchiropus splendidus]|uniref:uncharacterized protein LOC128762437 n=1 Tax=Synchiropus splendidus TaxID=270530 RepID=UPI00237DF65B|nr:uncharacterized protein LOC128762437 [Synchiropus splendidus]
MASVQTLRQFVDDRLAAVAEEIFGVFQQTVSELEEEVSRQRKLLEALLEQPVVRPLNTGVQQLCMTKQEDSSQQQEQRPSPNRAEPKWLQNEDEVLENETVVQVKCEIEDLTEEEPPACCMTGNIKTEDDGEVCGAPEPADSSGPLPLSVHQGSLSSQGDTDDTDDSEDWRETTDTQPGLDSKEVSASPDTCPLAPGPSSSSSSSSSSTLAPQAVDGLASAEDETLSSLAVGEQNAFGCRHVDRLAEYLVGLRSQVSLCLSHLQASSVIALWESLEDGDKQQVADARHRHGLLSGHFRTPKSPSETPGAESATDCLLAQCSHCRLVESIFVRLCGLHSSPGRKGKGPFLRWSFILRDYHRIRDLVLSNARVMAGTELQLVEVSQDALIQWHSSWQKSKELSTLLQGAASPPMIPASEEPLQVATARPAGTVPAQQEHQDQLPRSTAAQARKRQGPAMHKGTPKRQLFVAPPTAAAAPVVLQAGHPVVYFRYVLPRPEGSVLQKSRWQTPKRPYRRTVQANTCKKCGQFRTAGTGHSQFRGRVYCPYFESLAKRQWLEEMRRKFSA